MDPSEALSLPGVKAYVSSDDVPGDNKTGYHVLDEEIFATDKVVIFFSQRDLLGERLSFSKPVACLFRVSTSHIKTSEQCRSVLMTIISA